MSAVDPPPLKASGDQTLKKSSPSITSSTRPMPASSSGPNTNSTSPNPLVYLPSSSSPIQTTTTSPPLSTGLSNIKQLGPNKSKKKQNEDYQLHSWNAQRHEQNALLSTSIYTAAAAAAASAKRNTGFGIGTNRNTQTRHTSLHGSNDNRPNNVGHSLSHTQSLTSATRDKGLRKTKTLPVTTSKNVDQTSTKIKTSTASKKTTPNSTPSSGIRSTASKTPDPKLLTVPYISPQPSSSPEKSPASPEISLQPTFPPSASSAASASAAAAFKRRRVLSPIPPTSNSNTLPVSYQQASEAPEFLKTTDNNSHIGTTANTTAGSLSNEASNNSQSGPSGSETSHVFANTPFLAIEKPVVSKPVLTKLDTASIIANAKLNVSQIPKDTAEHDVVTPSRRVLSPSEKKETYLAAVKAPEIIPKEPSVDVNVESAAVKPSSASKTSHQPKNKEVGNTELLDSKKTADDKASTEPTSENKTATQSIVDQSSKFNLEKEDMQLLSSLADLDVPASSYFPFSKTGHKRMSSQSPTRSLRRYNTDAIHVTVPNSASKLSFKTTASKPTTHGRLQSEDVTPTTPTHSQVTSKIYSPTPIKSGSLGQFPLLQHDSDNYNYGATSSMIDISTRSPIQSSPSPSTSMKPRMPARSKTIGASMSPENSNPKNLRKTKSHRHSPTKSVSPVPLSSRTVSPNPTALYNQPISVSTSPLPTIHRNSPLGSMLNLDQTNTHNPKPPVSVGVSSGESAALAASTAAIRRVASRNNSTPSLLVPSNKKDTSFNGYSTVSPPTRPPSTPSTKSFYSAASGLSSLSINDTTSAASGRKSPSVSKSPDPANKVKTVITNPSSEKNIIASESSKIRQQASTISSTSTVKIPSSSSSAPKQTPVSHTSALTSALRASTGSKPVRSTPSPVPLEKYSKARSKKEPSVNALVHTRSFSTGSQQQPHLTTSSAMTIPLQSGPSESMDYPGDVYSLPKGGSSAATSASSSRMKSPNLASQSNSSATSGPTSVPTVSVTRPLSFHSLSSSNKDSGIGFKTATLRTHRKAKSSHLFGSYSHLPTTAAGSSTHGSGSNSTGSSSSSVASSATTNTSKPSQQSGSSANNHGSEASQAIDIPSASSSYDIKSVHSPLSLNSHQQVASPNLASNASSNHSYFGSAANSSTEAAKTAAALHSSGGMYSLPNNSLHSLSSTSTHATTNPKESAGPSSNLSTSERQLIDRAERYYHSNSSSSSHPSGNFVLSSAGLPLPAPPPSSTSQLPPNSAIAAGGAGGSVNPGSGSGTRHKNSHGIFGLVKRKLTHGGSSAGGGPSSGQPGSHSSEMFHHHHHHGGPLGSGGNSNDHDYSHSSAAGAVSSTSASAGHVGTLSVPHQGLGMIKTTMRKRSHRKSFNEDKPWKHHTYAVILSDAEKKRYEGLWAANKGSYLPYEYVLTPEEIEAKKNAEEKDAPTTMGDKTAERKEKGGGKEGLPKEVQDKTVTEKYETALEPPEHVLAKLEDSKDPEAAEKNVFDTSDLRRSILGATSSGNEANTTAEDDDYDESDSDSSNSSSDDDDDEEEEDEDDDDDDEEVEMRLVFSPTPSDLIESAEEEERSKAGNESDGDDTGLFSSYVSRQRMAQNKLASNTLEVSHNPVNSPDSAKSGQTLRTSHTVTADDSKLTTDDYRLPQSHSDTASQLPDSVAFSTPRDSPVDSPIESPRGSPLPMAFPISTSASATKKAPSLLKNDKPLFRPFISPKTLQPSSLVLTPQRSKSYQNVTETIGANASDFGTSENDKKLRRPGTRSKSEELDRRVLRNHHDEEKESVFAKTGNTDLSSTASAITAPSTASNERDEQALPTTKAQIDSRSPSPAQANTSLPMREPMVLLKSKTMLFPETSSGNSNSSSLLSLPNTNSVGTTATSLTSSSNSDPLALRSLSPKTPSSGPFVPAGVREREAYNQQDLILRNQQLQQKVLHEREKLKQTKPEEGQDTKTIRRVSPHNTLSSRKPPSLSSTGLRYRIERDPRDDIHGYIVRELWRRSRVPDETLSRIWDLVDRNHDGTLDRESFLVGIWLVDQCLYGRKLPHKINDAIWKSVSRLGVTVEIIKAKKKNSAHHHHHHHSSKKKRPMRPVDAPASTYPGTRTTHKSAHATGTTVGTTESAQPGVLSRKEEKKLKKALKKEKKKEKKHKKFGI